MLRCFGSNRYGQLGLGPNKTNEFRLPQTVAIANVKVIQVACSARATAAVTGKLSIQKDKSKRPAVDFI